MKSDLAAHLSSKSTEQVHAELKDAQNLVSWIVEKIDGVEIKGEHRHRVPGQLYDLAIEHHAGIIALMSARVYGSAFALVRCEFECLIRGLWLHYCATDEQLNGFVEKDEIALTFGKLIEEIEEVDGFEDGLFSSVKDSSWSAMNGYTHGGIHQVSRRMVGEYIEPSFEDGALLEVIRFSGAMALIGLGQIAFMADRKDLWDEVDDRLQAKPPTAE